MRTKRYRTIVYMPIPLYYNIIKKGFGFRSKRDALVRLFQLFLYNIVFGKIPVHIFVNNKVFN